MVFFCAVNNIFIDFKLIKNNNVRFINKIIFEDVYFGIVLVLNISKKIYQTNYRLYNYRVRPNSILTTNNLHISKYMKNEYSKFNTTNPKLLKKYFGAASMTIMAIKLIDYLNLHQNNKDEIIKQFMRWLCSFIPEYLESKNDPYNLIDEFYKLYPYSSYCHFYVRFAIKYPKIYSILSREIAILLSSARLIKRKINIF